MTEHWEPFPSCAGHQTIGALGKGEDQPGQQSGTGSHKKSRRLGQLDGTAHVHFLGFFYPTLERTNRKVLSTLKFPCLQAPALHRSELAAMEAFVF
jgi:hypothetical protein